MERNKKNTLVVAQGPITKKGRYVDPDVKGALKTKSTEASEKKARAEINGPKGPEPTRYGDWEQKGRCTDF